MLVAAVILYHGGVPVPGDLGVTGFFVLSGFLITWLLLKEHDRTETISLKGFYMRRVLRIFPAYFAFIGLTMLADYALGLFERNWGTQEILSALTYTVNYDNAFTGHDHPTAHAWSLAIEEQFYLLWPAIFLLFRRRDQLVKGLLVMITAVVVWRSFLYIGMDVGSTYVYNAFDTRFDSLAIGCLIAVLCRSDELLEFAPRLVSRAWYPVAVLALLYFTRVHIGRYWHYSVGYTVESILLGIFMLQLMQLHGVRGWRWVEHPFLVWMGVLSYPLYLWHLWGLGSADRVLRGFGGPALELAVGIGLSFGLAAGSYYVIEKPFLRLKKRLSTPKPGRVHHFAEPHGSARADAASG